MLRAALYARVSTEEQATEGASIPAQLKSLREYAVKHDMVLVQEFVDEGVSARTSARPQFQRMVALAKHKPRPFDVILIHKTDRFARNREDAIIYKSLLRRDCGIEIVSITEQFEDSPTGKLLEGIMEVMAEFYSLNLSQEVKKGMTELASQGKGLGVPPLGYRIGDNGFYVVDDAEAAIVRWVFAAYVEQGQGLLAIARRLHSEGPARFGPAALKCKWSSIGIRNIIQNPAYVGTLVWNRRDGNKKGRMRAEEKWILAENAHTAIVERETFERANRLLKGRRGPRSPVEDYLLRGMVRCLDCGGSMAYYRQQWRRKDGEVVVRPQLSCTRYHHSRQCYFNHAKMDEIEAELLRYLAGIIAGRVDAADIEVAAVERAHDSSGERAILEKQLEATAAKLDKQLEAFEIGAIDLKTLQAARARVEAEREELSRRLGEMAAEQDGPVVQQEELQRRIKAMLTTASDGALAPKDRRQALQSVVEHLAYSRKEDTLRIVMRVGA